ncbi:hypothetical protein HQ403_02890, partial [Candidatus Kaiserbacteria bacterium]|nr:hypothetical protein [Candidatus Kaiserbacteria bacterium]
KDEEEFIIQSIIEEQEKRQRDHIQQEPVDFPTNEHSTFSTDAIVIETDANGQSPRLELRRTGVAPKQKIQNQHSATQPIPPPIYKASHITSEHKPQETTSASVIEVIRTIVQGNTPHLLEIIQEHKATRKEISDILIQALCELDRLYARRMGENETLKDESIEDLFENWDNKDIGQLVHVLSTGIDQNYLTQHTSAKMALLRGLECAQEVKNK